MFHAVGTDAGGDSVDFTIPMMFVSISDIGANRTKAIAGLQRPAAPRLMLDARSAVVPGQKSCSPNAMRPRRPTTRSSSLAPSTSSWWHNGTAPRLLKADVSIPQVQELLGSDAPTTIRLYPGFVDQGLDAATGVFAEIVKEDFGSSRPSDPFAGLVGQHAGRHVHERPGRRASPRRTSACPRCRARSDRWRARSKTPIADVFDPTTFFQKGTGAALRYLRPLRSAARTARSARARQRCTTESQDIPGGKLLIAKIDWEPEVDNLSVPPGLDIADLREGPRRHHEAGRARHASRSR